MDLPKPLVITNLFLCNTMISDSKLKKKSQIIYYPIVMEGSARDKWGTEYVNTHYNTVDILTELIPMSEE